MHVLVNYFDCLLASKMSNVCLKTFVRNLFVIYFCAEFIELLLLTQYNITDKWTALSRSMGISS